jgi:hypothetical protein
MTADISRLFRDKDKRFHGLVRQQGRLPLDAEENHGTDIGQWTDEQSFVETIAPSGSPDDGFKIANAGGTPTDFVIKAGSYYLGGSRIENPAALNYRAQKGDNWIPFQLDAEGGNETVGPAVRKFLVWLDAREAVVTATEDSELLEPGLGGPDGAARKRFSWRVRTTAVAGPGCIAAAQQWLTAMQWTGLVDSETGLLASGATLQVGFNPADVDQDLCQPSLTPGFLGARNECYRVMVTRPGHYVWGQDDAAPLYRVQVQADGAGNMRKVKFLSNPRDEFALPRADHVVELLRWDQILPNGQKTAEAVGAYFKVSGGYVDGAITLASDVPAAWTNWLGTLPASLQSDFDDLNEKIYYYLRVWTGGGDGADPDIPFAKPNLAGTGLSLTFGGTPMVGDAWAIAARPNAPSRVMPWQLLDGMAPHATRRHVVPLAYVDLDAGTISDCRRRFRPLYKIGGCCTVTVGDGVSSWGDVSTIAAALARLPTSGGEICIGPGTYAENILVTDRANVTFTGCGRRTRWIAQDPSKPLLELSNCDAITVRRLRMEGGAAQCILADLPAGPVGSQRNSDLLLEELDLAAHSGSAIIARHMEGLRLRNSTIAVGPFPAGPPPAATKGFAAVTLQGEQLFVERNLITAPLGPNDLPSQRPLGGLHIGGDSRDIVLLRNRIDGGAGNGITLGSVRLVEIFTAGGMTVEEALAKALAEYQGLSIGFVITIDAAGCIHIVWQDPGPSGDGDTIEIPVSDGLVSDVRIEKNRIGNMGASGIATFPMFVTLDDGQPAHDAVAVENILVLDNVIAACMTMEPPPIPDIQFLFTGFGGVALSMALDCTIRDNQIAEIGAARQLGVCGIFVGYGEDLRFERNRIEQNGASIKGGQSAAPAGGIFVRVCAGGISSLGTPYEKRRNRDRPALWVQSNIIHAPYARALKALVMGPAHIADNRLSGANPSLFFSNPFFALIILIFGARPVTDLLTDPTAELDLDNLVLLNLIFEILGGDAVNIVNLGIAEESLLAYRIGQMLKSGGVGGAPSGSHHAADAWGAAGQAPQMLRGGETLFVDNQVSLHRAEDTQAATLSSVLILTRDDLGFADNQLEVEADMLIALSDALLMGTTIRAHANRLQESALCMFSMMSWGLMLNVTADNQSTFQISASCATPKLIDSPNLSLF